MRGLAFPTTAVFEREDSHEHGTPFSNGGDIPIDPALSAPQPPQLDPALVGESAVVQDAHAPTASLLAQQAKALYFRQYAQGPQGDPFAPQPPPSYLPTEEPSFPPPKPVKRKRKPRRETECGFCQGNDTKNKVGQPEKMVTCSECGRSGHPTCMHLAGLGEALRAYDWKCIECKTCEMCQEKGDDSRILFCDACDRGWHMECLQPPLTEEPPGKWHCPLCPPPAMPLPPPELPIPFPLPPQTLYRESSVASSSHPVARGVRETRKGKAKATVTDDSEVDVDDTPSPTTSKHASRKKSRWKGRPPMRDEPDAEEVPSPEQLRPPKRPRVRLSSPVPPPKVTPVLRLKLPARGKGKEREEDQDESKKGMFDDFLSPDDRDVAATTTTNADKLRFEKSRTAVEEKLIPTPTSAVPEVPPDTPIAGPSTRPLRSAVHHPTPSATSIPAPSASPTPSTPGPTAAKQGNSLRIRTIRFGEFDIQTWYDAPFPEEYANIPDGRLWICEFCLRYMKSRFGAGRHRLKCKMRHPPGDEIYRDGFISIFEVDGRKNKIYCQNLCLLSKMFLDHKSLFYDVEPFLFYVMTEVDDGGARFVGYFSKEKRSPKDYNVSCIMTLPVRQRQGWGNLLIDFSYLLSKKEQRPGSPEKPLSALGALGYKNYWTLSLMRYLQTAPPNPRLEDICAATSMTVEDIYTTLTQQNMIVVHDATMSPRPMPGQSIKFPKGKKNGIARRHLLRTNTQDDEKVKGPFVPPRSYDIRWDPDKVEQYLASWESKGYLKLKPENLKWSPFLIARSKKEDGASAEPEAMDFGSGGAPSLFASTPVLEERASSGASSSKQAGSAEPPVYALFDDEVVEQAASKPPELPPTTSTPSRTPEPPAEDIDPQLERDRALAQKLATKGSPLRLRTRHIDSPDVATSSRSERQSQTPNGNSKQQRPVIPTRRTRSANGHHRTHTPDPEPDADAALAAKLAREIERPKRQLRGRPIPEQPDVQKKGVRSGTATPSATSRSVSPRKKRRRVESSPETEVRKLPTPPPVQRVTRSLPTRRTSPMKQTSPTKVSARLQRQVSRLANGHSGVATASRTSSLASSRREVEPNGALLPHTEDNDASSGAQEPDAPVVVLQPASDDAGANIAAIAAMNVDAEEDVKFEEEVGTPLTGISSRQSVVPSDDTVCAVEDPMAGVVVCIPNAKPSESAAPLTVAPVLPQVSVPVVRKVRDVEIDERIARREEEEEEEAEEEGEEMGDMSAGGDGFSRSGANGTEGRRDVHMDVDPDPEAGEEDVDAEGEDDAEGELDDEVS